MEVDEVDPESLEILKRKIEVVDKLLKHKEKIEGRNAELTTENLLKENMISSLKRENCELKSSLEEKTSKISIFETEKRSYSGRLGQLESAVAKKNIDLINKEVEINELKRTIENLEGEKINLEDQIKNDRESKRIKEIYEGEKWKYLAEISSLKQQNEALKQRAKEDEEISSAFRVEVGELEKCKKELATLKKEINDNKKDKRILALTRKLEKANTEILKLSKGRSSQDLSVFTANDEIKPGHSASFLNIMSSNTTFSPRRRFSIFSGKHKQRGGVKKTKFIRLGSLLYGEVPSVLGQKPVLSDSIPSVDHDQEEENIMLILNSSTARDYPMKRKAEVLHYSPKKKLKGPGSAQRNLSFVTSNPPPKTRDSAAIRIISPMSLENKYNSSQEESFMCIVQEPSSSDEVPEIIEPEPLSCSTPSRKPSLVKPSDPIGSTSAFNASAPMTIVENGSNQIYFNPNPSKSRLAHETRKPQPVPPSRISAPVVPTVQAIPSKSKNTRISKSKDSNSSVLLPATKLETSASTGTARSKILQTGLLIETPASVGKNLTEAQIAAARNRMVGRAPPGVATRPSVDGFRSSERSGNKVQPETNQLKPAPPVRTRPKVGDNVDEIPARRKTMPARISVTKQLIESAAAPDLVEPVTALEPVTSKQPEPVSLISISKTSSEETDKSEDELLSKQISASRSSLDDDLNLSEDSEDEKDEKVSNKHSAKIETSVLLKSKLVEPGDIKMQDVKTEVDSKEVPEYTEEEYKKDQMDNSRDLSALTTPSTILRREIQYRNLLDELLDTFNTKHRTQNRALEHMRTKIQEERKSFQYETYSSILDKNLKLLQDELNLAGLTRICDELCQGDSTERIQRMFCDYIYNFTMHEHKSVKLLSDSNPEAPPVTRNQQRVFTLLTVLDQRPQFKGVIERLIDMLYNGFFGVDRMFSMSMSSVLSLGRLLVLSARHVDDLDTMKRFVFDLFFFKSPRNHLLVGVIMDLWPELFVRNSRELTPEQETAIWAIFHTGVTTNIDMEVQETRSVFQSRYGYQPTEFQSKDMISKYLKLVEKNVKDSNLLSTIKYCLVLLGRGHDYRWVNNTVISQLINFLTKVWTDECTKDQTLLRWVIESIGLVSRLYPSEGRTQLVGLFDSIKDILMQESIEDSTVDSCVNALLHLGYHLQTQVALWFVSWKPTRTLHPTTRQRMEDFIGTRGRKHAEITSSVARKNENRKRKNKGFNRGPKQ